MFNLIYIPIWLDLLLEIKRFRKLRIGYLHSNMVRFIIKNWFGDGNNGYGFTFQYG